MPATKVIIRGAAKPKIMPFEYFSLIAPYSLISFLSDYSPSKLQKICIPGKNSDSRGTREADALPKARQMLCAQAQSPGPSPDAKPFLRPPGNTDTFRPQLLGTKIDTQH